MVALAVRGGLRIDTSITAMMPVDTQDSARKNAMEAARDATDLGMTLLLRSENQTQLDSAEAIVREQLSMMPELIQILERNSLPEPALSLYKKHRFFLLSEADWQQLNLSQLESFKQDTLTDLYGATAQLRILDFELDPFNTLGSFLESRLESTIQAPELNQHVLFLQLSEQSRDDSEQSRLTELFDVIYSTLSTDYPEVELKRSAVFFFAQHAAQNAKKDINLISAGSLLGMLLLLFLVFRSAWPIAVPLASIIVGVLVAFSVVHSVFSSVHVFTIVFGASLIGIVIDYSIHYFFHTTHNSQQLNRQAKPVIADAKLMRALVLSLLSSVVGYAALALSGLELLEKIALFSVCGVIASWLTVVTWAPRTVSAVTLSGATVLGCVCNGITVAAKQVYRVLNPTTLVLFFVITVGLISLFSRGQDDPRKFIELPAHLIDEGSVVAEAVSSAQAGRYLLLQASTEQALFDLLNQLSERAGGTEDLISALDWLPSPTQQLNNYRLSRPLYEQGGMAGQLISELGMSEDAADTLAGEFRQMDQQPLSVFALFDGNQTALPMLVLKSESALFTYVFLKQKADIPQLKKIASALDGVEFVDAISGSTHVLTQQRQSALIMLLVAYSVMMLMLFLLYRQIKSVFLVLIPACATLVTVLILTSLGQAFTLFHTMALFLILGLGMDYAVFLAEMWTESKVTLRSVLLSALTSMISFGFLSLSSIPVAQAFGLTVFLGSAMNLFCTFVVAQSKIGQLARPLA